MSDLEAGEEAQPAAQPSVPQPPAGGGPFGGLSPREAALRRAAKQREEREAEAAAEADTDAATLVRVPVRLGQVLAALEKEARGGSVQAARELRAYLSEFPPDDGDLDLAALTQRERTSILARLLAEVQEEEGAAPAGPMGDVSKV